MTLSLDLGLKHDPDDVGYDLILSVGQSNESGRGNPFDQLRLDPPTSRVLQFGNPGSAPAAYANVISQSVEPLYHADTPTGIGHAGQIGQRLTQLIPPNRRVLIVPCAYGGTGFSPATRSWDVAKINTDVLNLSAAAVTQANLAWAAAEAEYPGRNRWLVMSWHQGEADAGSLDQAGYATAWDAMLAHFRANITGFGGCPVIVGPLVPEWIELNNSAPVIVAAHVDTGYRNQLCAYAGRGPRGHQNGTPPSIVHYDGPGQRLLAVQMLAALPLARANVAGSPALSPGPVTLTQSGFSVLASWQRPLCRVTDYVVEYRINAGGWSTLARARSIDNAATIGGAVAGDTVAVRVSTVNEQGASAASPTGQVTLVALPAAVASVAIGTVTSSNVALSWAAAARAAAYLVQYKRNVDPVWTTYGSVAGLAATVPGLANFTSYDFQVIAVNAAGQAAASPTANATTLPAQPLSTDVGITPWAAYGLRKLVAGYAGAVVTVRRDSDNATLDVGVTGSGDLDTAALLAFAGAASCFVTKRWDQSGNGRHLTNATTTKQPQIVSAGALVTFGARPTVTFDGVDDSTFGTPVGLYAAGAATLLAVCQAPNTNTTRAIWAEGAGAQTQGLYMLGYLNTGNNLGSLIRDQSNSNFAVVATTFQATGPGPHQISVVDTGSALTAGVDGTSATPISYSRSGRTVTPTQSAIGAEPSTTQTFYMTGQIAEVVLFAQALNVTQEGAGRANQKSYYSIT